jgi:hypothetical protein
MQRMSVVMGIFLQGGLATQLKKMSIKTALHVVDVNLRKPLEISHVCSGSRFQCEIGQQLQFSSKG